MSDKPIRLLIFGATGLCGRSVVERALLLDTSIQITAFVRDEERAKTFFSNLQHASKMHYHVGDIYSFDHVRDAVTRADAVISCISSYSKPHNQMSSLTENVLKATQTLELEHRIRYIHFGFPRGRGDSGTSIEHAILALTEWISCTKYGPSIRDHVAVQNLLEQETNGQVDYSLFAAPAMVDTSAGKKEYYGCDGTVEMAIETSRVWNFVSTRDAADLMLSHLLLVMKDGQQERLLPKLMCLSYK